MTKVLILIEAERHENCPHPEVGPGPLPTGWRVLPIDSNLYHTADTREYCQKRLLQAAKLTKTMMGADQQES